MLGPLLCSIAAFRLWGSPLQTGSLVLLGLSLAALAWSLLSARTEADGPSRLATASQHITAALGGFFLFVSFAVG